MLDSWGRFVYRRRWPVLIAALAAVIFAIVWGTGVFGSLKSAGGFDTPGSESLQAAEIAARDLPRSEADVVVLYRDRAGRSVDDPAVRAAVSSEVAALPKDKVVSVGTYYSTGSAQLVSADRTKTYAVLQLAGADDEQREENYLAVKADLAKADQLTAQLGGRVATSVAINERVGADIARAEAISIPILLILLVIIFGSLAAAAMPLAIGLLAILGSFTVVHALTLGTDVSVFVINITTFLGLGLAIDYGLFIVARFREELGRGRSVEDAVAATMATAGRTVLVSGVTVALSLAGLILFPQLFLRSMGYGGVATVLVDMIAALTVLPALLAVLGPKINGLAVRRRRRRAGTGDAWGRLARNVMRRPVWYLVATVAVLLALGAPFLRISWGGVDSRVLPAGTEARVVAETLEAEFPRNATSPIDVVVKGRTDPAAYARQLAQVPGVTAAAVTAVRGETAKLALRYDANPDSTAARDLVQRVRDVPAPPGTAVYVGGTSAITADQLASLGTVLPWVALVIGLATFTLLFLAFGSVVLPIKAIAVNLVSLTAAFGVVVWIFQDGNLSGLLDFTATGAIGPAMPVLMLAIVFGLSMDYEVFLLSRIREHYDLSGDNTAAVTAGLRRTGSVITSAALLFVVAFAGFATSGIMFMKLIGIGMVVAIAVDATIVRALLVPATMRLLGQANWWAPGPLARIYRRYGIREDASTERELAPAGT
jgi:trehalose monomycolate/heme transporter